MIIFRDIAHAKLLEQLETAAHCQTYQDHPVYYAGPAKTPDGMASGSFVAASLWIHMSTDSRGRRLACYAGKGQPVKGCKDACQKHGGFYLGSIGGVAAKLALESIKKVKVLEFPELGMEAVWRIEVEDFPAFIVTDDKGNDFFELS